MAYFDTGNSDHTARLHPEIRDHPELDNVARRTERDVIGRLSNMRRTQRRYNTNTAVASDEDIFETTATSGVVAVGYPYDSSASDAPDGEELEALLDAIADVISHRLLYLDEDYEARSEGIGGMSRTRGRWDQQFPEDWRSPLKPWQQEPYAT